MKRRVTTIQTLLGDALSFYSLVGHEALSQGYVFDIDLLGSSNALEPKALLGKSATVHLQTETGIRYIGGIVTRFGLAREDNRQCFYRMRLRPWLWLATRRSDFRIFQDQSVPDVVAAVLGRYSYPMEQKLSRGYRTWSYCVQYGESDFDFVSRLCEHEGICFYFRHEADQHVLVFADDMAISRGPLPGSETVRYHPHEKFGEHIHAWESSEEVRSGHYFTNDHDFEKPGADLTSMRRMPASHDHDSHEQYEWPGGFVEHDDGETYARIRTEEQLSERSRAQGQSTLRELAPGYTIRLAGHPRIDQNQQYLLLGVSYHLRENMQASEGSGRTKGSVQHFAFDAQPTTLAWRPARTTSKPRTRGPQTAVAVGPPGEEIWTDRYGRIKVRFHWDRLGQENGNASCWVRVSTSWAGAAFGATTLPRIGQEVVVNFLNGDPDFPIVTGRVHNAGQMPAWALPDQTHLTGIRSRELDGWRGNHIVLDDTSGKIQAQLSSDHHGSSLSLGHIARIEDTVGRKDLRGQGFELRTDGHGAVRAAGGLLVTTEGRQDARAHITDVGETIARLAGGRDLHESLSKAAKQAKAHEAGDQDEVARALKEQNEDIRGRSWKTEQGHFPEFQKPHLTLASPAGIQTTAEGSTHIASGEHTALTSGGHSSIAAGRSFLVSARNAVRMFARKAGMRLKSANADIDITALKNSINVLAKLNIKLEAGRITITGREEVVIVGGGSFSRWNASGIVHGTEGVWREHAATHSFAGPKSMPVPPINAKPPYQAQYVLQNEEDGALLVRHAYRLDLPSGRTVVGQTNDRGETVPVFTPGPQDVHLHAAKPKPLENRPWKFAGGGSSVIPADYLDAGPKED